MEAHDIPEPIQWHEGLLLTPQHFQQLSLRQESLLSYVAGSVAPFNWGVRRFEWDRASLGKGVLRVLRLEAVMRDGLVVSFGTRRGEELSVSLEEHAEGLQNGGSVMVYLAVAARDAEPGARGGEARYRAVEGEPVADEQTGDGALVIPRLRPRLKLLAGETPGKSHVSFPLARVTYEKSGGAYTLRGFIPPTLAVTRDSELGGLCSDTLGHMLRKAEHLAKRLRSSGGAHRAGLDRETETLLRCLAAPLPQLNAVLSTGVSHPYLVYLAFCAAAGQVAVMGGDIAPRLFGPYDHDNLAATFAEVLVYIKDKVEAAAPSTFATHDFVYNEREGLFEIRFDPAWAGRRLLLGMRARPGMSEAEVVRWGMECVIGPGPRMESLRRRRVTGAPRAVVERDEDLVPARDEVLFTLAPDREYVEPRELLQVYNGDGRGQRPAAIVLYVRHRA